MIEQDGTNTIAQNLLVGGNLKLSIGARQALRGGIYALLDLQGSYKILDPKFNTCPTFFQTSFHFLQDSNLKERDKKRTVLCAWKDCKIWQLGQNSILFSSSGKLALKFPHFFTLFQTRRTLAFTIFEKSPLNTQTSEKYASRVAEQGIIILEHIAFATLLCQGVKTSAKREVTKLDQEAINQLQQKRATDASRVRACVLRQVVCFSVLIGWVKKHVCSDWLA